MPAAQQHRGATRRRENAFLLAAARVDPVTPPPVGATLDWPYLLRAADRHGIMPLLHTLVNGAEDRADPAMPAATLQSAYWSNHFRNAQLLQHLGRVLEAAAAGGVPVMPLKGAILAQCYYPTPALRPMSDLDLLVPPGATATFAGILRDLGYREIHPPAGLLDPARRDPHHREWSFALPRDRVPILIEFRSEPLDPMLWQLTELDRRLSARLRRHTAKIWDRSHRATFDGAPASGAPFLRISPEDLLLHVASHMLTRHTDFRLLWLHDIGRVVAAHRDRLDWDYLAGAAHALHLAAPVLAALQAAARWVGASLPQRRVERHFCAPSPRRWDTLDKVEYRLLIRRQARLDEADLAADPPTDFTRKLLSLLRLRGGGARLRALRWALVPSRAYIAAWHGPDAARSWYRYALTTAWRLIPPPLRGKDRRSRHSGISDRATFTSLAAPPSREREDPQRDTAG